MQSDSPVFETANKNDLNNPVSLNRFHAFGIHLFGSVCVALASAALVYQLWYPAPLAEATGVTQIFLLLLTVDVVIGPVITLLVFNTAKKELKRDLFIVLLLQLCALFYGLQTVFIARPVYMVFNAGQFDLAYANDFTEEKLAKATKPAFKSLPLWGPETIAASMPDDPKKMGEIVLGALTGKDDLPQMPEYFQPYLDKKADVIKAIKPIESLRKTNANSVQEVDALIERYAQVKAGIGYLLLIGKVKELTVVVARDSAEILEINTLRPR